MTQNAARETAPAVPFAPKRFISAPAEPVAPAEKQRLA